MVRVKVVSRGVLYHSSNFNVLFLQFGCARVILKNNKKSFFARLGFTKISENHYFSFGFSTDNTDSKNENFFFLHEQIFNFLKGHVLLVTNRDENMFFVIRSG